MINPIDRLLKIYNKIIPKDARIGLIANQCSFSFLYKKYLYELLPVHKIFLLEHGFFSELQDQVPLKNIEFYHHFKEIEWISLYGNNFESLKPSIDSLIDIDILIVDIQDVGSRYYTFLTSVYYVLETIINHNLELKIILLDRPNPLIRNYHKRRIEGTPLEKQYESFVGITGILHQHGLTPSELITYYWAHLIQKKKNISKIYFIPFFKNIPLQKLYPEKIVIYDNPEFDSNFNFFEIYPSPNMPSLKTAKIYTGQCLLEGTNLSEGRGTTKPFEIFGAPYIDFNLQTMISDLPIWNSLGVIFRKIRFVPVHHKFQYQECNGWQLHIINEKKYHSLLTTLIFLKTLKEKCKDFDWYKGIYEFKNDFLAIEYLLGDKKLISFLETNHLTIDDIYKYITLKEKEWLLNIKKFYLYN
ncbi:MAG: hypothetical protein KatS3mg129_0594 [Leptospiraceae bacterium]|nr:MAG: hypothetical protein KatS3mg129_0594 [Leptospiraceae bacterium]